MSLNKVMLIGNVGKDPEIRYLEKDKLVCNFSIATTENYTDKNTGEKKSETEWHRLEMWDNLAKIAEKYIKKGNQIYVEGKLKTENWKDKDGIEKSGVKIRVTSLTLLGGRSGENKSPDESNGKPVDAPNQSQSDDDLPF
jgi:single-strand DNA-binding protein